jgi:hypothetical protein
MRVFNIVLKIIEIKVKQSFMLWIDYTCAMMPRHAV